MSERTRLAETPVDACMEAWLFRAELVVGLGECYGRCLGCRLVM